MICKNCGADIGNKGKCEYCDTVYFEEFQNQTISQRKNESSTEKHASKGKIKNILEKSTLPTKIALIFWFVCCIVNFPEIKTIGIFQYICVVLFGFLLFGCITQVISTRKKKKHVSDITNQTSQSKNNNNNLSEKAYDEMDGHEFERFCGDVLGKSGFTGISITKSTGDQGIDIIAFKDGMKYGIQCKCYSSNIGNAAVQQAFAGKTFYGCHVVAVLTNRYFTKSAKELAERNGVLLWDRDRLNKFIDLHK